MAETTDKARCPRLSSREADPKLEMSIQEVYYEVLLAPMSVGNGKQQERTQGAMGYNAPYCVASADPKGVLKLRQPFKAVPGWGRGAVCAFIPCPDQSLEVDCPGKGHGLE